MFFNGTVRDWRVIVPELGTVEGPFQIASLEYSGQHDGEISFDMGLEFGRRARVYRGTVTEGDDGRSASR